MGHRAHLRTAVQIARLDERTKWMCRLTEQHERTNEIRFKALEERMNLRFEANDKAIALASTALSIRLEHSNGLIEQMNVRERLTASKESLAAVDQRVDHVDRFISTLQGRDIGTQNLRNIGMLIVGAVVTYLVTRLTATGP